MKKVYTARDPMEAHFVRGLLEQQGIRAIVLGELLGLGRGELPFVEETLPSVWVDDMDDARATILVREHARHEAQGLETSPSHASWTCGNCGQRVEGQFSDCWSCEAPRPQERGDAE